jgi:hypothetical protein
MEGSPPARRYCGKLRNELPTARRTDNQMEGDSSHGTTICKIPNHLTPALARKSGRPKQGRTVWLVSRGSSPEWRAAHLHGGCWHRREKLWPRRHPRVMPRQQTS